MEEPPSAPSGSVQNDSEQLPNASEHFGTVPQDAEAFRTLPHKEKTEQHTLTVRQVTRLFEQAGVARTERSIVNWCQPNKHDVSRLDCYFEPNERRYFITKESVDRAIEEELAKTQPAAEQFGSILHDQPTPSASVPHGSAEAVSMPHDSESADVLKARIQELEKQITDKENLRDIDRRVQDQLVTRLMDQLKFTQEDFAKRVARYARLTGRLETQLNGLLSAPHPHAATESVQPQDGSPIKDAIYEGLDAGVENDEVTNTLV